jgi:hypothetical protein
MGLLKIVTSIILITCFTSTSFASYEEQQEEAIDSYKFIKKVQEDRFTDWNPKIEELDFGATTLNVALFSLFGSMGALAVDGVVGYSGSEFRYAIDTDDDGIDTGAVTGLLGDLGAVFSDLTTEDLDLGDGTFGPLFLKSKEKLQEFFTLEPQVAISYLMGSTELMEALKNMRVIYPKQSGIDECVGIDKDQYTYILNSNMLRTFSSPANLSKSESVEYAKSVLSEENILKYYLSIKSDCMEGKGHTHFVGRSEKKATFNDEFARVKPGRRADMQSLEVDPQASEVKAY